MISCNQNIRDISGTYKSYRFNLIEQVWLQVNNSWYSVGNTIELNENFTYTQTTCGNIRKGTWVISKDTLLLNVESADWRVDSLREFGFNGKMHPVIPEKPDKYLIKGNKIIQKSKYIKKGKEKLIIHKLKKI